MILESLQQSRMVISQDPERAQVYIIWATCRDELREYLKESPTQPTFLVRYAIDCSYVIYIYAYFLT